MNQPADEPDDGPRRADDGPEATEGPLGPAGTTAARGPRPFARHRWAPPAVATGLLLLVLSSLQPPSGGAGEALDIRSGQAELHEDAPATARERGAASADAEERPAGSGATGGAPAAGSSSAAAASATAATPADADATRPPVAAAASSAAATAGPTPTGVATRRPSAPVPALGFATDFAAAARAPEPVRQAPAPKSAAAGFEAVGGSGTPGLASFFGAPAHGSRFVYIIDKSGSMSGAPFEAAKAELLRSLRALRRHERFFVIFYDGAADPMPGDRLVSAEPRQVQDAVDWIRSVSLGGSTDPTEALTLALRDLRPDTIWLLSDGAFDKGVLNAIAEHNGGRKTHINTLAFVNRSGEAILKRIAEENRGDYSFVPGP